MTANVVMALTVKNDVEGDSSDEEMTDEELAETYKLMYNKWKELCVVCEKQKKIINTLTQENTNLKSMSSCQENEDVIHTLLQEKKKLQDVNTELQEEASLLESKLERLNKYLRLLNNGTNALDNDDPGSFHCFSHCFSCVSMHSCVLSCSVHALSCI